MPNLHWLHGWQREHNVTDMQLCAALGGMSVVTFRCIRRQRTTSSVGTALAVLLTHLHDTGTLLAFVSKHGELLDD